MLRLFIFSPVKLFGEMLAMCVHRVDEIEVCATHQEISSVADTIRRFTPDLVLFDVTDEHFLGEAGVVADTCPDIPILAVGLPEISQRVIDCADAGFVGYVPRDASISELCAAIHMTLRGQLCCPPSIAGSLLRELHRRRDQAFNANFRGRLTPRESEVLKFVSQGLSNKMIARELKLSLATVKNHIHNAFAKLGVRGRREALVMVRNEPWIIRTASVGRPMEVSQSEAGRSRQAP